MPTDPHRPAILREMLRILSGPDPVCLAEIRDELERAGLVEPSDGAQRAAVDRTLRNHLTHLRRGCQRALGDRQAWVQGSGDAVGMTDAGKGPWYRLRLRDALPHVDADGQVRDGADGDALDLARDLLAVPGGGPFRNALGRVRDRLLPDGEPGDGVAAAALDAGTSGPVLEEVLRILHRNGGQGPTRVRYRRWLRLRRSADDPSVPEGRDLLVWPVLLHPAWVPPCPGWRLLAWDADGWHDLILADMDHASPGPMVHEMPDNPSCQVVLEAFRLHEAAFCGSCPGPLHRVEIRIPRGRRGLLHMRWGAEQTITPDRLLTTVTCTTSDAPALCAWARMAGVEARLRD